MRRVIAAGASALAFVFVALLSAGSVPAWGAELGATLEERVAELEATAARSGNSKLSFRIYGQINRALLFWNDGFDSNVHGVDNHTSSSRFGFTGQTAISPGWVAGYRLEIETRFPSSDLAFNAPGGDTGFLGTAAFRVRHSYWNIANKDLGGISVGFQSPATDDVTLINLGSQMSDAAAHYNNSFRIRLDLANPPIPTNLAWGQIVHDVDSLRGNFVRYDTPIMKGFLLSSAWNDAVWDVALRHQNGSNNFRVAAGIGYMKDQEREFQDVKGSGSLIHDPTGLYASVAGGLRDDKNTVLREQAHFYYAQLGISKQWLPYGKTTVYADHGLYKNYNVGEFVSIFPDDPAPIVWGTLTETSVRRWGLGIEQAIDAAGMLLYAQAHLYDPTVVGFPCAVIGKLPCGGDPKNTTKLPAEQWQGFVIGARIQF